MQFTKTTLLTLLLAAIAFSGCTDGGDDAMNGEGGGMSDTENNSMTYDGDCVTKADTTTTEVSGFTVVTETGVVACEDVAGAGSNDVSISDCGGASSAAFILDSDDWEAGPLTVTIVAGGSEIHAHVYQPEDVDGDDEAVRENLPIHDGYTLTVERDGDFKGGFAATVLCNH